MTTRAVFCIWRERSAVRRRYSDSGVVTRMCGGVRSIAARSGCGVSLERTAAVLNRRAAWISRRGTARFLWMSARAP